MFILAILAILTIAAMGALGQTHGDYRSAVSGNWGTVGTWTTYDTLTTSWVAASVVPASTNNVTIKTGDSVMMEASGKNCLNLTIEANAKLYTNSTSNRYLNIYGGTLTNDGVMGEGVAGDGISINFGYTNDLVMQGSGNTDISRIRPNGSGGYGITFDQDVNLHFVGAALYSNAKANTTYTVNAGKTLSFGPGSFFAYGTNGATATSGMGDAVVNILGTMSLAPGSNFNPSVAVGNTSTVNIYGQLAAGDSIMSNGAGSEVFNIYPGGRISFATTDTLVFLDSLNCAETDTLLFEFPLTIGGKLKLSDGIVAGCQNIKMLNNSTIDRVLGTLANKPIFTDTVNIIYSGTAPCTTSYEMPYLSDNTVVNLTVNHEITLDSTRYVNDVEANGGPIIAGGKSLGVFGGYGKNSADGYVIGFMGRPVVVWGATQQVGFMVGTANGFSPATVSISGVTKAGLMGCRALEGVHPEAYVPQETMQRQWTIGWHPDSAADYESASLKLYYLPEDFNTSFTEAEDESTMVVGTVGQDDSTWSFPLVTTRIYNGTNDGGMIEADGLEPFPAMFTMAKSKYSLAGDVEPPVITGTSPANGATGVALDTQIWLAFSEPMDTLSLAGDMQPGAGNHVVWNPTMDTLTLTHDPLAPATTYTLSLMAITDLAGNPLAALPDSFMFTTVVGDTIRPYVASVSPAWGATGVGLNDTIVIAFSEPMNTDSLDGFTDPFHDFTPSWNAAGDTFTLVPQYPYPYSTVMSVIITAGIDLAGNSMAILPDTVVQFTTAPFQGPSITLVQQPEDTYDGTGPFPVRAVITDLGKAGIAADTLWYSDSHQATWWAVVHTSTDGDTFNYSIPGPLAAGTVIEFFFGAWDDGGTVQYDPSMYRGYQFRILSPLAPTGLAANGGNLTVDLSWAPPAEIIDYSTGNGTGLLLSAGDISDTRFTPQHYPCKLEQVASSWWNAIGTDSVEVHVWADNGDGLPDRSVDLVPPRVVMPLDYPNYTVIDLSSDNLVLFSGDFHVGYVIRTDDRPMPMCDGDGPGLHSTMYDSLAGSWGMVWNSDDYNDWSHQAVVSYANYTKGLKLKSYVRESGDQPLTKIAGLKAMPVTSKQAAVYPELEGALFLAKNITGYDVMRSDVSGGPYSGLAKLNSTTYTDSTVLNNNTYYYVVRALYVTPDTFSEYSNEASATPTGVEGRPEVRAYVLQLRAAAPNPMTTGTAIRFSLPASAQASLEVFNVLGQKVTTLANGKLDAGYHTVNWDGTDRHGAKLASGVYIYQLRTMNKTLTKRITILR
jgi:hypothetical protein